MTKDEIISEIVSYFGLSKGTNFANYYVGITNDVERRLFHEHNVLKNGAWIYCPANDKSVAQDVEKFFLNLGMIGDTGGGMTDTTVVYCYLITSYTKE